MSAGDAISGPTYVKQREVEALLDGNGDNERLLGIIFTADPEILLKPSELAGSVKAPVHITNDKSTTTGDVYQNKNKSEDHGDAWCRNLI